MDNFKSDIVFDLGSDLAVFDFFSIRDHLVCCLNGRYMLMEIAIHYGRKK